MNSDESTITNDLTNENTTVDTAVKPNSKKDKISVGDRIVYAIFIILLIGMILMFVLIQIDILKVNPEYSAIIRTILIVSIIFMGMPLIAFTVVNGIYYLTRKY